MDSYEFYCGDRDNKTDSQRSHETREAVEFILSASIMDDMDFLCNEPVRFEPDDNKITGFERDYLNT